MYSFFPQALIVVSIAGIVVIILRKVPGVAELFTKTPFRSLPKKIWEVWGKEFWQWLSGSIQKVWRLALEVKEISKKPGFNLQNFARLSLTKFHIPKPSLGFLKRPDSLGFFLAGAQKSLEQEDYQEAERLFIKVLKKDQGNEQAFAGLGKLYLAQKKFEEAAETFKFLIKHHPENDSYYSSLGQAHHGQKLYDQAIEAYEQAIELAPQNPKRYVNLGLTLEAKKHIEEAVLNYRKAADLEKDNPQFLLVLAEALTKKGDKEEAEAMLEQILQLEPTNHAAREKLMQLKF
jgi:tetratricopeptide (TPR) repeat protein